MVDLSIDGLWGGVYLLITMGCATVNASMQLSVGIPASSSLGYIPTNENAGSYDNSMFNIVKNDSCFPSWLQHFIFPSANYRDSFFSTFLPTLVLSFIYFF